MSDYVNIKVDSAITAIEIGMACKSIRCVLKFDAEGLKIERQEIKRRRVTSKLPIIIGGGGKHPMQVKFGPPEDGKKEDEEEVKPDLDLHSPGSPLSPRELSRLVSSKAGVRGKK